METLQVHTANGRISLLYHCKIPKWQSRGNVCEFVHSVIPPINFHFCNCARSQAHSDIYIM